MKMGVRNHSFFVAILCKIAYRDYCDICTEEERNRKERLFQDESEKEGCSI